MTVLLCVELKKKSIKCWQHLSQAAWESIKCKALLSSAMNLDIDLLEELAVQSTTIMESVNQPLINTVQTANTVVTKIRVEMKRRLLCAAKRHIH